MSERLKEIQERVKAATPGPWNANGTTAAHRDEFWNTHEGEAGVHFWMDWFHEEMQDEDAVFIAAARDDVPWLLARLTEVETEVGTLTEALREVRGIALNGDDHRIADPLERLDAIESVARLASGVPADEETT